MTGEGIAFILSAPSGTGKTTIRDRLLEKLPDLQFIISHTTREPRKGEKDGVDYYFISEKEFKDKIKRGDFLEWARFQGHHYGTAHETLRRHQKKGQDLLLELDIQGVETLRKNKFPGVFIFILPPSIKELTARLKTRGTDTEETIARRVAVGKEEIKKYGLCDYVTTNFNVEDTVDTLISIIRAEKCRTKRYVPSSPDLEALLKPGVKV